MKFFEIFAFSTCFAVAYAKEIDINQVLRNQMEQLVHLYDSQRLTQHHRLKDKAELDCIKKDLMNQFRKMANETEHKLGKHAQVMKIGSKQRYRNRKMRSYWRS